VAFADSATDFHREKFHRTLQSAIYEQDGDSVDYRIAARAAGAADDIGFEQEALAAGWTNQPTQIVCSQGWHAHGSMLDAGRAGERARYHRRR
jgi:hypothetical protein